MMNWWRINQLKTLILKNYSYMRNNGGLDQFIAKAKMHPQVLESVKKFIYSYENANRIASQMHYFNLFRSSEFLKLFCERNSGEARLFSSSNSGKVRMDSTLLYSTFLHGGILVLTLAL
jgi:hypothetical protein